MNVSEGAFLLSHRIANSFLELWHIRPTNEFWKNLYDSAFDAVESTRYAFAEMLSQQALKHHQWRELQALIIYAVENTKFYNKLRYANPALADITSLADLPRFPILTKSIVRDNGMDAFVASAPRRRFLMDTTTGSSGTPFVFFRDRKFMARRASRTFQIFRFFGIEPTAKKVVLKSWWGGKKRWLKPENILYLSHTDFESRRHEYLKEIMQFGGEIIESYPSQLLAVAHAIQSSRMRLPFKVAFSYSEQLWPEERKFIEDTLQLRVYSYYGTSEFGNIGFECLQQDGFHLFETELHAEVVDEQGRTCEPGAVGRILISYFPNRVMPFIRYDIGDTGSFQTGPCSCGLPYKKLRLFGRRDDYLLLEGKKIYGSFFHPIFQKEYSRHVRQYQVIQYGKNQIQIQIVPETSLWRRETLQAIGLQLRELLGPNVSLNLQLVHSIPVGSRDKHQAVIRRHV